MENYGVPQSMLDELVKAEKAVAEIRARINKTALKNLNVEPGEIMKGKYNGLSYMIEGFSAYVDRQRVRISVNARRYFQSGRREGRTAYSTSYVSFDELEKLPPEKK